VEEEAEEPPPLMLLLDTAALPAAHSGRRSGERGAREQTSIASSRRAGRRQRLAPAGCLAGLPANEQLNGPSAAMPQVQVGVMGGGGIDLTLLQVSNMPNPNTCEWAGRTSGSGRRPAEQRLRSRPQSSAGTAAILRARRGAARRGGPPTLTPEPLDDLQSPAV
jgi:hypothetical protein